MEFGVDHGEFPMHVLESSHDVVASGQYFKGTESESGWKPTAEMYEGRRDYRTQRIFTIDPTTAKDLDDALHVTDLGNGQVEIGVHIADVSFFVSPEQAIDIEAQRRCTTVYLGHCWSNSYYADADAYWSACKPSGFGEGWEFDTGSSDDDTSPFVTCGTPCTAFSSDMPT